MPGEPAALHQRRQHQRPPQEARRPDHPQQLLPPVAQAGPESEDEEAARRRTGRGRAAAGRAAVPPPPKVRQVFAAYVAEGAGAGGDRLPEGCSEHGCCFDDAAGTVECVCEMESRIQQSLPNGGRIQGQKTNNAM